MPLPPAGVVAHGRTTAQARYTICIQLPSSSTCCKTLMQHLQHLASISSVRQSAGTVAVPQPAAGGQVFQSPLRYFADLADSRLPSASSAPTHGHQLPARLGSLQDALAVQRDQVLSSKTTFAVGGAAFRPYWRHE